MNQCRSYCRLIKRMCNDKKPLWNLSAAWSDIVSTCAANAGKTFTESVTTISTTSIKTSFPFGAAVLSPGGLIYGVPYNYPKILKIDTNNDTVTYSGSFSGSGLYASAVLAPNGFIYGVPGTTNKILKINPATGEYTTFGNVSSNVSGSKWGGCCVAPNGCIYGIPCKVNKILKIDINTDTTSYIDTAFSSIPSEGLYQDGQLAPNGCIYCSPRGSVPYMKIDPSNDTYTTFGGNGPGNYPWSTFSLAQDGNIYASGNGSSNVLKIDTSLDSISTIAGYTVYGGSALAPNGYIYSAPRSGTTYMLKIDPINFSVSRINISLKGFNSHILAPNGCIYALQVGSDNGTNRILKINPGADVCQNFKESTLLSPYLNKY